MNLLYGLSVVANGVALVLFFLFAYRKNRSVFAAGTALLALGTCMLLVFLAIQGVRAHTHPTMMPFLSYNFFAVLIYLLFFLFEFKFQIPLLGTFIVPVGFFFNILSLFAEKLHPLQVKAVSPLLLGVHTGFLMLGEAFFILAFASSVMYMIQEKNLKSKRFNQWYSRLPSLSRLEEMTGLAVSAGFPLITLGLLIGFYWASHVWGGGWYFDPKVVWSVCIWFFYAWLFYGKVSERIHGRSLALAVIWCVALIFVSFLVSRYFTSVHSMKEGYGVR